MQSHGKSSTREPRHIQRKEIRLRGQGEPTRTPFGQVLEDSELATLKGESTKHFIVEQYGITIDQLRREAVNRRNQCAQQIRSRVPGEEWATLQAWCFTHLEEKKRQRRNNTEREAVDRRLGILLSVLLICASVRLGEPVLQLIMRIKKNRSAKGILLPE